MGVDLVEKLCVAVPYSTTQCTGCIVQYHFLLLILCCWLNIIETLPWVTQLTVRELRFIKVFLT